MDVHRPRKIRRARVVEPVIIGEPRVFRGDGNQIARARMVNAGGGFFRVAQEFFHAGSFFQNVAHGFFQRSIVQINVRDLMIGHGENLARAGVENFQAKFILHRQPAVLAKNPVQMHRRVHVRDAVFGKQNHLHSALAKKINQIADDGVNLAQVAVDGGID